MYPYYPSVFKYSDWRRASLLGLLLALCLPIMAAAPSNDDCVDEATYASVPLGPYLMMMPCPDDFRGHTTGELSDAFLAVNGKTVEGTFFRETVTVSASTDYEFGAWVSCAITSATPTAEGCPGADDGTITVVATGAATIDYTLSGNGITPVTNQTGTFAGLADGSYDVAVADATDGSCSATQTGVVVAAGTDTEAPTFADQSSITLFDNNGFESPNATPQETDCGGGIDLSPGINHFYGDANNTFVQQFTVEVATIDGTPFIDGSGTAGNYAVGMFNNAQEDRLALIFNNQGKNFLNVGMDIAPTHLLACISGTPAATTLQLSIYDAPAGTFNSNSPGTLLDQAVVTSGAPNADPFDLNWTAILEGLDISGATNGTIALEWDVQSGTYMLFDNLVITASNISATEDCPSNLAIQCLGELPAATVLEGFDNCDPNPTVTFNESTIDNNVNDQTVTRTWTVTDAAGLSSQCVQTVTIADTEAPTFTCPASFAADLDLCGDYTLTAEALNLNASDACGGTVTVTLSQTAFSGAGTTNVTVTVSDGTNSDNSCVVPVTLSVNPNTFSITTGDDDLGDQCPSNDVVISAATLLGNDNASDGRNIEVQDVTLVNSAQGTVVNNNDGTFTFSPANGVSGAVAFEYLVTAEGDNLFFSGNGHYYDFIEAPGITWDDAKIDAEGRSLFGEPGYLVTITSQAEQGFVTTKLQGQGWMGATDLEVEGTWKWVVGPEAGTAFWQGQANGSSIGGAYTNWQGNEPNNLTSASGIHVNGEDYAHFRTNGQWNDFPLDLSGTNEIQGYVVEYGSNDCIPDFTATGNISLNLVDDEAPVLNCKTSFDANLGTNEMVTVSASDLLDGATTDNCATTFTEAITGGDQTYGCGDVGAAAATLTVTVDDGNGNAAVSCDVTINVTDTNSECNSAPTMTCAPVTVDADGNCMGAAAGADFVATSNDPDGDALTFTAVPGGPYALGTTNVTVTADDGNGGTATCTTTITVEDAQAPTVPTLAAINEQCAYDLDAANYPTTTDGCDGVIIATTAMVFPIIEQGTTTITWIFTDAAGNSSTATQDVVIDDTVDPVITCPQNIAVSVDAGVCGATVDFDVLATDNCATFGAGDVLVLKDIDGIPTQNLVTALQTAGLTVTLSDIFEYQFDGTNINLEDYGAVIHLNGATFGTNMPNAGQNALVDFVENQGGVYITSAWTDWSTYVSGGTPLLSEIVLFSRSGGDLNSPMIAAVAGQENHPLLNGLTNPFEVIGTHTNGGLQSYGSSYEPVVVAMTGATPMVAIREFPSGGISVNFRSTGNWQSRDYLNDLNLQQLYINAAKLGAGSGLSISLTNNGLESGEEFPVGTTENIFTADDGNGNTANCSFTVTVTDNEAPVANCKDDFTVILDVNGEAPLTAADLDNVTTPSSDNCSVTLSIDGGDLTYDCDDVDQTFTLTLTADDGDANSASSSCTVDVTVSDPNNVCYTCDLGFSDGVGGNPPGIITSRIVCGNDGAITVNAFCNGCDDGNADLRYSISPDPNSVGQQVSNVFTNLTDGSYTVTILDVDHPDCNASTSATIGECVGEIPGNNIDDDCDTETDEPSSIAWVLLDSGEGCTSNTDDCAGVFCYGLEYTPTVSGTLTSYTTGFLSTCIAGSTPLISNLSCVMDDNSFDAEDCGNSGAIFFNSSGNNGTVVLTKDMPIILHQICLSIPAETTLMLEKDDVTDITLSIDVSPILSTDDIIVATDRPDYTEATAAGNMPPVVTANTGAVDACYATVAEAEAAALLATTATDDFTPVGSLVTTVATVGTCSATVTVTVEDACGLTTDVTYATRIDNDDPVITGTLETLTDEGCVAGDARAAADNVADLEAMGVAGFDIMDNCTDDATLVVTHVDASTGTCTIVVTRTYTITDECGNSSSVDQTINVEDTTAPAVTGAITPTVVEGCDISVAPAAVSTVADLEGLLGDLLIEDACTDDATLAVTHEDVVGTDCPIIITRTYTITDACTNSSEVVHTITVEDTVLPEITATGTINECYTTVELAEAAAMAAVTVTDNCDASIIGVVSTVGDCTATITINAQDACGNDAVPVTFNTQITGGAVPTEVGGPVAISTDIQTTLDNVVPDAPVFEDVCGNTLTPSGPAIGGTYVEGTCVGTITYTYTYTDCAGTSVDWTFTYNVNCQGLRLKVFTEGGLNAGANMLSTEYNENHLLPGQNNALSLLFAVQIAAPTPAGHPYGDTPWSFTDTDGTAYGDFAGQTAYPDHVADWVLVTVRMGSRAPAANVWKGAGWLHENGEVTFPEGSLANDVTLDAAETYYIVVEHRNHLPVLATATVQGSGANLYLEHDFTVADSYAPIFRFGQKEVVAGVFAMYAGNADQMSSRASINSSDRTAWRIDQTKVGYYLGDFNQNMTTNSEDETIWKLNQNKTTGIVFE